MITDNDNSKFKIALLHNSTLVFLKSLKKNNNKIWFDENREKYNLARADFEMFINEILNKMTLFDADLKELETKKCIFRINRDIRFSKDKTPYKTFFSASFKKGDKKSINAGYYFQLEPGGNSYVVGGLWNPEAPELKKMRQEIDYCFPEFKRIINNPTFKKTFGQLDRDKNQVLVNVPKGYEKENPAAEYLKLKSFVATRNVADEELLKSSFSTNVSKDFKALMPLIKFINRAFE